MPKTCKCECKIHPKKVHTSKACKGCNTVKDLSSFYKAGIYYQSKCIQCFNSPRTKRKLKAKGYFKLPEETRCQIELDISKGLKPKDLTIKYNLKCANITRWIKNGDVPDHTELVFVN